MLDLLCREIMHGENPSDDFSRFILLKETKNVPSSSKPPEKGAGREVRRGMRRREERVPQSQKVNGAAAGLVDHQTSKGAIRARTTAAAMWLTQLCNV